MRRFSLAALALASVLAAPGWAQADGSEADRLIQAAHIAYRDGNSQEALSLFERAAKTDKSGMASYNAAVLRFQMGDKAAAVPGFRAALTGSDDGTRRSAYEGLASVAVDRYSAGDFAGAEALYRDLIAVNGLNRDILNNYSLTLYKQRKWNELEGAAERLTTMDPLNDNAWLLLFNARKGRHEAAAGDPARMDEAAALRASALDALEKADGLPVRLSDVAIERDFSILVKAKITGNLAPAGSRCTITFHLLSMGKEVATASVPVAAPAKGETVEVTAAASTDESVDSFGYSHPLCEGWQTRGAG